MNEQSPDLLNLLERWFISQCDDEWEHRGGVTIESLDIPGWAIDIDLIAYPEPGQVPDFTPIRRDENEHHWLHAWVDGGTFRLRCGPEQLTEGVALFLETFGQPQASVSSTNRNGERKVAG